MSASGAHTGYFTVLASRLVGPAGRVVAIEPSPDFHRALTADLAANGCHNVRTVAYVAPLRVCGQPDA
ncbi:hypothetical protein GCM10014715_83850 [Streptomyces spiralis]|uniref:FkbM family methyltransferase n=1 Tax=Streptomyces spiralis TaxID=66376 RepID=A0A919API8_9ACTN|nr:hypothetical protein [Streptomyces spiralis]GHF15805.1 hypothetical protein GCM10014715_83850 [Streptomyces spiralis]